MHVECLNRIELNHSESPSLKHDVMALTTCTKLLVELYCLLYLHINSLAFLIYFCSLIRVNVGKLLQGGAVHH